MQINNYLCKIKIKTKPLQKFPLTKPDTALYKALKKKNVVLTMVDKTTGVDNKFNIYKIQNGIAIKL